MNMCGDDMDRDRRCTCSNGQSCDVGEEVVGVVEVKSREGG